jgi:hypothetical protein
LKTLRWGYTLALCLVEQHRFDEGRNFALRAADGAGKNSGISISDREYYERLNEWLQKQK